MRQLSTFPIRFLLGLLLALPAAACGGGGGGAAGTQNLAPSATAGEDRTVFEGERVVLAGTADDRDGSVTALLWTQTAGPEVAITGVNSTAAKFVAPQVPSGSTLMLEFSFSATDDGGVATTDTVAVAVESSDFIVYLANPDGGPLELWVVGIEPDAPAPIRLSGDMVAGGEVRSFAIAPDRSRVLYIADQDVAGVRELYTTSATGGPGVKLNGTLVAEGGVNLALWSPDSTRVVYSADQDSAGVIETYTSFAGGGGNAKINGALVAGGSTGTLPAWSPDSSRVLYEADQDTLGVREVYTSSANGEGNVKINGPLAAGGNASSAQWSPDGTRILYGADQDSDGVAEVYTSLAAGGGNVKVNGALVAGGNVSIQGWSPDGSRILYSGDQDTDGVTEIYTSLAAGGGNVKINGTLVDGGTDLGAQTRRPLWSPDGSRICYISSQHTFGVSELYTSLAAGGGNVRVNGALADGANVSVTVDALPRWAPDSSRLVFSVDQRLGAGSSRRQIYTGLADGRGAVKVQGDFEPGSGTSGRARFSPDSVHVLYVAAQDTPGVFELYTATAEGGEIIRRSQTPMSPGHVGADFAWAP